MGGGVEGGWGGEDLKEHLEQLDFLHSWTYNTHIKIT